MAARFELLHSQMNLHLPINIFRVKSFFGGKFKLVSRIYDKFEFVEYIFFCQFVNFEGVL